MLISVELLKALEDNNDSSEVCTAPLLGVTSYGVSMTTLEEVFLQLEETSDGDSESSIDDEHPVSLKSSRVEIVWFDMLVSLHFPIICCTVYSAVLIFLKMLQNKVDSQMFILFWQTGSTQDLLKPRDAINVEDGGSRVSGSVNALHKAGVELNNPELQANSQKPVWKAKQQLLGLLKVR